jgi:hypothetical protein
MRRFTSLGVIVTLILAAPLAWAQQPLGRDAETLALRQLAAGIPTGTRVKVRTSDGRRLTATLMAVDDRQVIVKRHSRVPEPAVSIAFADLADLHRDEGGGGFSVGKAIGIGLAAGVGAILTMFAIAVSIDD